MRNQIHSHERGELKMSGKSETATLRCFDCGDEQPEDGLTPVAGKGNRSPRHFCDDCKELIA